MTRSTSRTSTPWWPCPATTSRSATPRAQRKGTPRCSSGRARPASRPNRAGSTCTTVSSWSNRRSRSAAGSTTAASAFRVVHDHITSVFRHDDLASALAATELTEKDLAALMRGIILAGGSGTRLYPITMGVSQAAGARLRQADDLLPAVDADDGGHPRHPGHHHARRCPGISPIVRRRWAFRHQHHLRGAGPARRPCAGICDRCRAHR